MIDVTGKFVVITGSLRPLTRQEAMVFLENQGAIVQNYVSAQTEVLITGHKQLDLFEPDKRSKKYEAVMKRKASGQNITIISEEAFFTLVKESHV
ncbi:BRCT domain-containing protein [Streptococcus gallolyticus]|uniref:BRCT domain-containing protein n=1 Tax=Streptococcus gallolyticus TaxID=315405 RepID=UPI0022B7537F|nr:BRCT domain-containing protein [Streptococcus gallolyticus]WAW97887.1 BRCT domain-containing protein [Streptococcus gallolyticus]WAW98931.1 BRCT domain-containing protein [Streptococcus gallolyticus]